MCGRVVAWGLLLGLRGSHYLLKEVSWASLGRWEILQCRPVGGKVLGHGQPGVCASVL